MIGWTSALSQIDWCGQKCANMYEAIKSLRDIYRLSLRVTDAAVSEDYRSTVTSYHCALVYALGIKSGLPSTPMKTDSDGQMPEKLRGKKRSPTGD